MKTLKKVLLGMVMVSILSLAIGCSANSGANTQPPSENQQAATESPAASPGNDTTPSTGTPTPGDTDGDGIPDDVEAVYGTNPYAADTDGDGVNDKEDQAPVQTDNLINETSTTPLSVNIDDVRVEDNATADHLEITMTNTGDTVLSQFDIYYTITDKGTSDQESYYQVLTGLSLNPGEKKTIHFDNDTSQAGHYYGNMNGLYGTSANGLVFDIQLHAKGFAPMAFTVEKAVGTAEVAD